MADHDEKSVDEKKEPLAEQANEADGSSEKPEQDEPQPDDGAEPSSQDASGSGTNGQDMEEEAPADEPVVKNPEFAGLEEQISTLEGEITKLHNAEASKYQNIQGLIKNLKSNVAEYITLGNSPPSPTKSNNQKRSIAIPVLFILLLLAAFIGLAAYMNDSFKELASTIDEIKQKLNKEEVLQTTLGKVSQNEKDIARIDEKVGSLTPPPATPPPPTVTTQPRRLPENLSIVSHKKQSFYELTCKDLDAYKDCRFDRDVLLDRDTKLIATEFDYEVSKAVVRGESGQVLFIHFRTNSPEAEKIIFPMKNKHWQMCVTHLLEDEPGPLWFVDWKYRPPEED